LETGQPPFWKGGKQWLFAAFCKLAGESTFLAGLFFYGIDNIFEGFFEDETAVLF
jgi:hypothetical protein